MIEEISSFENLVAAEKRARLGKRDRHEVAKFRLSLESNLIRLSEEIVSGQFSPGEYRQFSIRDPKVRLIAAPTYRDRIVHHAVCAIIEPSINRTFIEDSFACRKGKGTHAAMNRLQGWIKPGSYALHCDVRQFFPSIDHGILLCQLARRVPCHRTLTLLEQIIRFSPAESDGRGLPIGALTSQLFSNMMLDPLDRFVKQTLHCRRYLRYCDDFLLLHEDKQVLNTWRDEIETFLITQLKLDLHPKKRSIYPVTNGVPFLGFRLFPGQRRLNACNGRRFVRRLNKIVVAMETNQEAVLKAQDRIRCWQSHANHGDTIGLQRSIFNETQPSWVRSLAPRVAGR
jgi:retron-type reverse transcriptase